VSFVASTAGVGQDRRLELVAEGEGVVSAFAGPQLYGEP
jgi:hypothetical protein